MIAPLLTEESSKKALKIMNENKGQLDSNNANVKIIQSPEMMQLPIERLTPHYLNSIYNRQTCVFCEYFLHYVQEAITKTSTVVSSKLRKQRSYVL